MKIKENMSFGLLSTTLSGEVCKVPDLGLEWLFMVTEIDTELDDPIVLAHLDSGALYRLSELPKGLNTEVLILNGYWQQTL